MSSPIKTEEMSLPGFGAMPAKMDLSDYKIRYLKANLDDINDRTELEILETKALPGVDVVLLSKDKFTFMDKYFVIVSYLEKTTP